MVRPERHVFVCRYARPGQSRPCCDARGSGELYAALLAAVGRHRELSGKVQVTESGCLGPCFTGPNMVVYPDGVWYAGVTADDVAEIVAEHLVANRPVARLAFEPGDEVEAG